MKTIFLICIFPLIIMNDNPYKINFRKDKKGGSWRVINDGVMGGLSRGKVKLTDNTILFKGKVSLDNNGGFSSLRRSFEKDLSEYSQIKIRYRSKGISLAFTMAVSSRWYVPNYKKGLENTSSEWKTITIKLTDFEKHYIGRPMNEKLTKDALQEIVRIGFITDEKKYGDFEFEVNYIEFL